VYYTDVSPWVCFGSLYLSKNLCISSKLFNLLAHSCLWHYFIIIFISIIYPYFLIFYFILFLSFKAASTAYGSSQARGLIGLVAAGLCQSHSNARPDLSHIFDLRHSSRQRWILNPLREARDWTLNLMVSSRIVSTVPQWELHIMSPYFLLQLFASFFYLWSI